MPLIRILFVLLGSVSLVLGVIGAFLPVLPTTPFLLLTAFLYFHSSPKCYEWLIRQPYLGSYIRDFREKKVIPLRAKVYSLVVMWVSIFCCVYFFIDILAVKIMLVCISILVSGYILSFKSN